MLLEEFLKLRLRPIVAIQHRAVRPQMRQLPIGREQHAEIRHRPHSHQARHRVCDLKAIEDRPPLRAVLASERLFRLLNRARVLSCQARQRATSLIVQRQYILFAAPGEHSPDGFTALHIAAFAHNAAAVRALLAAGADVDVLATASFATVTPLGTAATFGANEIAELLLDAGADTEKTSDHGNTPLHSAAANDNRALVELLLARGANKTARLEDGRTAADLAPTDELRQLLT